MSFETIVIHRDFPIINNFVQVPPNNETDKNRVSSDNALQAIDGAELVRLSIGSGKQTGNKCGQQEWLRIPGLVCGDWYITDPVDILNQS